MKRPFLTGLLVFLCSIAMNAGELLKMQTRQRVATGKDQYEVVRKEVEWDARKTAVIICDMWDQHWCKGATRRVAELAPVMNEVVKAARAKRALIIHAPSSCMDFYKTTPQRFKAISAPKANPPAEVNNWRSLNLAKEGPLPIDDSDGGCDDQPQCAGGSPWKRQIAALEIGKDDAISDRGDEIYNLLQQEGIDNVLIMGVHANMCVLGRPFSIRQMVSLGKNVLLVRDMTDTMYNSRRSPYVNHFRGTDLVVEHIEKHWCASTTSASFTGRPDFRFAEDKAKEIVFMIGEPEYDTRTTLPAFYKKILEPRGLHGTFIFEDPNETNNFPGLEKALEKADLLIVSTRRKTPRKSQLEAVRAYLAAGKPLAGIRTASHGFDAKPDDQHGAWTNFDAEVFGGKYMNHYGKTEGGTTVSAIPNASKHPVLTGIPRGDLPVTSTLYKARNLANTATPLMDGRLANRSDILEPVAWVNTAYNRRAFYTSLGAPGDFALPFFERLLLNGILWCLDEPIPPASNTEKSAELRNGSQPRAGLAAPMSPAESFQQFKVPEDLEIEQVLAEPIVRQPLSLSFDERGRLWVVQYLQYPHPAGLKILSRDNVWRVVYDKVPAAPPNHVPGADKITIHEDTDGDGIFDKHTTFIEGLNIATAVARGRGGVWVLNPPYLLFYPDRNNDDIPDGPPEVRLSGFGLEDSHSVANSLRWGPDGWLYAAQGSTVTGAMLRPGLDKEPLHTMGQLIWRYHPESRRFEVFAEGGGNAFGVEIDAQGRIFSGHNGGNTRGFYYVQGAYEQKGFEKHGPLSNPYAFGYFLPMKHPDVERFTHTFLMYEADALPERYRGKLFGVEPLQGRVVYAERTPDRSSFQTRDLGYAVTTSDKWFRPVDIKLGPDGAIYVADWYDQQVNHYRNHEGLIDTNTGRIYRIKTKGAKPGKPFDLGQLSSSELAQLLRHPNKWQRQTALRLLADRRDASVVPALEEVLQKEKGQNALEAFWALNLLGKFDDDFAARALEHQEALVREWAARLLGDRNEASSLLLQRLASMALKEPDLHVRSQLASTAKRLPHASSLIRNLLSRGEDAGDIHIPLLLWWAIESKADKERDEVLSLFREKAVWDFAIVRNDILERLMRRFASPGTRHDLLACAELLDMAPDQAAAGRLLSGFDLAFKGRPIPPLPEALSLALARSAGEKLPLALRQGEAGALEKAIATVENEKEPLARRLQIVQVLGDMHPPKAAPALLNVALSSAPLTLRKAAFNALRGFDSPEIGKKIAPAIPSLDSLLHPSAFFLLSARPQWGAELVRAVEGGGLPAKMVPLDTVRRIQLRAEPDVAAKVKSIWKDAQPASTPDLEKRIAHLGQVIRGTVGTPYEGQKIFTATCAVCHKLFGQGGQIGPDLTTYKRDDIEVMLLSIVNPSAEIREGYENFAVTTKDGQSLTGFLAEKDNQVIVLRGLDGENTVIPQNQIGEMKPAGMSLMPEGLLDSMTEQDVRNLFAYLRSTQPLVK